MGLFERLGKIIDSAIELGIKETIKAKKKVSEWWKEMEKRVMEENNEKSLEKEKDEKSKEVES